MIRALIHALEAPFRFLTRAIWEIQSYTFLSSRAIANLFTRPIYMREVVQQMDRIGVGSLTIILLTGFFTGAVLAIQSESALRRYGAVSITGQLVAITLVRELGPVLSALMLSGRIGSGVASELGSMVVSEQINAMRALGTDPIRKLVLPRILAGVLMVPLLTVVSGGIGMVGAWIVTVFQLKVASSVYWNSVVTGLYIQDVWMGLIKPFFIGFAIVSIGCHVGLRTKGGTQGVGRSTTNAVVASSVAVIVVDFLVTKVLIELMY